MIMDITLLSICSYLAFCLFCGLKHAEKIKTLKKFALGYTAIPTAVLVATVYATHLGSIRTIGVVEKVYQEGMVLSMVLPLGIIGWWVTKKVFCNNIHRFVGCISQGQIMEKLYGEFGLWLSNVVVIITSIGCIGAQVAIIGSVMQYFFQIDTISGLLCGATATIVYTMTGGVRAVIMSDVMQASIFGLAVPLICLALIIKFGGPIAIWHSIPSAKLAIPLNVNTLMQVLPVLIFQCIPLIDPPFLQRYLISGNKVQLNKTIHIVMGIDLFMILMLTFLGWVLVVIYPKGDLVNNGLLATLAPQLSTAAALVGGISLLAITMSTADSWLNASAVILTNDVVKKLKPWLTNMQQVLIARISTITIGVLATFLATAQAADMLSIIILSISFYLPIIMLPMGAGFLGYRYRAIDLKIATALAISMTFLGAYYEGTFYILSSLFGLTGSLLGLNIRSLSKKACAELLNSPGFAPKILIGIYLLTITSVVMHISLACCWVAPEFLLYCSLVLLPCFISFVGTRAQYFILQLTVMLFVALGSYWLFYLPSLLSVMQAIGMLVTLIIFAYSIFDILWVVTIGSGLGWALKHINTSVLYTGILLDVEPEQLIFMISAIISILGITGILSARHKMKSLQGHSKALVSELNPALSSLSITAGVFRTLLQEAASFNAGKLDKKSLKLIFELLDDSEQIVSNISNSLSNTLWKAQGKIIGQPHKIFDLLIKAIEGSSLSQFDKTRIEFEGENFELQCDGDIIVRVLSTLLTNRIRYSGKNTKVMVKTKDYRLKIFDQGQSIDPEKLATIFDPSTQVGSSMAFCKEALQSIDATIEVHSEPGQLTEFILDFTCMRKSKRA